MSKENPFPYGKGDGSQGCVGCRNLTEIMGMDTYPLCLEKGEDFACEVHRQIRFKCWEAEEGEAEHG